MCLPELHNGYPSLRFTFETFKQCVHRHDFRMAALQCAHGGTPGNIFPGQALAEVICSDRTQYGRGDKGVFRSYLMNTVLMLTIEILKQRSCYISQT